MPREGGSYSFAVAVGAGCGWMAETDVTWAELTPSNGQGSAEPVLTVDTNRRVDGRSFLVTVGEQSFKVVQLTGCAYSVEPESPGWSGEGGRETIDVVTTLADCPWSATANENWIHVLTPSGSGSSTIGLDVDTNTGGVRHAFVTIGGQRVDVTQRSQ